MAHSILLDGCRSEYSRPDCLPPAALKLECLPYAWNELRLGLFTCRRQEVQTAAAYRDTWLTTPDSNKL